MPIKLIALDIDKTLIDDNMRIPAENISAIQKAVLQGCHVVIVSGRIGPSVRKYMHILGIQGMVPSLGGCMIEKWDGTIVQDNSISSVDSALIYDITRKYNQYPLAFIHTQWYSDEENIYWADHEFLATGLTGKLLNLRKQISETGTSKMLIPAFDTKVLDDIKKEIDERCSDTISCFLSSPRYLEVMPKGVTKGTAIDFLIDYFKIKREETMAIGDYYNDVDMFNAVGFKASVDNAPDDIKSMVDYVSSLDNNHGAVGEIINRFVLM